MKYKKIDKKSIGSFKNIRDQLPCMYNTMLALLVIQEVIFNDPNLRGGPRLIPNKMTNTNDEIWWEIIKVMSGLIQVDKEIMNTSASL